MLILFCFSRMGLCRSAYPEFLIDAWDQWDDEENSENDRPGELKKLSAFTSSLFVC